MSLGRNVIKLGNRPEEKLRGKFVRRGLHECPPSVHHLASVLRRIERVAYHQFRSDFVQAKFKRGHDTEVAATTAYSPKQIGIFSLAGPPKLTVRRDDLDGQQIIADGLIKLGVSLTAVRRPRVYTHAMICQRQRSQPA